jgi:hypothetical protein
MSTETISASSDPTLANKLVNQALSEQEVVVAASKTEIPSPPDTQVELPGGLFDPFDGLTTTVEIRELTGADEEQLARITDAGKGLLAILEKATVKIGDKPADKETLDSLLAGDREMILLAIRIATFGPDVKVGPMCPSCGEAKTFEIDLEKDVEIKKLNEEDREFTVTCKVGTIVLNLPTGITQKALVNATNKNSAELDTILLKGCIASINGVPVMSVQQIRDLSIKDRRTLLEEITNRNPGPQLSEIKKTCSSCEQEVSLPLTLADLFRE